MPREHPDPALADDHAGQTMVPPPRGSTQVRGTPGAPGAPVSRGSSSRPSPTIASSPAHIPIDTAVLPAQQAAAAARRQRKKRRIPIAPLLVLGLVVLLVAGVGYGAYVFLPTASITLRPSATQIQVPAFSVTADPNAAVVDQAAGVIPAQTISVPVHVQGTFNATGIEAHDTKATGSVRFHSENTLNAVPIPAGTVVSTTDGVEFVTQQDVTVAQASFATGPTQVDVDVRAAKGGIKGNVDADTITLAPAPLASQLITVTNPDPTSGGKHTEDQVATQQDYDAAVASLTSQLPAALQTALADPQSVPRGLVAFPQTAQMSAGAPDQPATSVVGVVAPSFSLALDATADMTAVNEAQLDQVAAARLSGALTSGQRLVGTNVSATHDQGTVVGDSVVYDVQASGMGYTDPDSAALVAAIRGKSLTDARAALASFGMAEITLWPDFVDRLPDQSARINITVVAPLSQPSAAPTAAPSTSTAPVAPAAS